jgi:uncharacterized protein
LIVHTGIVSSIDLDHDGKALGTVGLPFSVDRSPYYQVKVPYAVIRNGDGPRVLLMAGNHGDEYEGELALARLIRHLEPAAMRGLVTILPITNTPAVMAARRCSPLDGGNLNRAFPGSPSGTPTQRLAHLLEHDLFPRHDIVLDIHSGGTSMAHLPCALIELNPDAARQEKAMGLMRRLGFRYGFVADNGDASPTSMGAARRAGAIGLSGEFGGGGTVSPETMAMTAAAIDRLLVAAGSVAGPVLTESLTEPGPMTLLSLARHSQSTFAPRRGWFEPAVRLGDRVAAGEVGGWLHDLERLQEAEEELRFAESGIVIAQRLHAHCEAGDCLLQVATFTG